jgi:hypothetical protein
MTRPQDLQERIEAYLDGKLPPVDWKEKEIAYVDKLNELLKQLAELEKQLTTAVAEWKKWEQKAGDNWCSYVERIAALEEELEAERQRRWDGNEANSRELAECQARIEQYEKDVRVKSLKAAKREALLEAAERFNSPSYPYHEMVCQALRRMAEELK